MIGTTVGGIPDVIANEHIGMLIPPASADAINNAFRDILQNREATVAKIHHSFEYAQQNTARAFIRKLIGL